MSASTSAKACRTTLPLPRAFRADDGARRARLRGGAVGRGVVEDVDMGVGERGAEILDDAPDRWPFVDTAG